MPLHQHQLEPKQSPERSQRKAPGTTTVFLDNRGKEAARLGEHGFTNVFIAKHTGLSEGQVQYRLALAGIRRRDFRNGLTPEAKRVAQLPMSKVLHGKLDRLCRDIDALERHAPKPKARTSKSLL